jgi:hypothetical protein
MAVRRRVGVAAASSTSTLAATEFACVPGSTIDIGIRGSENLISGYWVHVDYRTGHRVVALV